jgi:hypothetical protein
VDVRFSGQSLFCQITRSELERLASGRAIELVVQLPKHHSFRVSVRPSPMSADRGGWQLDSDPTGTWLTIPRAELELLGQTTTFAERLTRDFPVSDHEHVQVILEALPDEDKEDRSVIEITPHPDAAS